VNLLEVKRGTAGLVTSIIDDSGWADVAGTMASTDDKVLTEDAERQANVLQRIPYGGRRSRGAGVYQRYSMTTWMAPVSEGTSSGGTMIPKPITSDMTRY